MAENKTALGLEVPAQVINSYKDLKAAVKSAQDQQAKAAVQFGTDSDAYKKASKNVADLKDKIDDLNDSSKSLKGSGIERSAQGFQQLGEGLKNLDFDKVKVGLTAIKSALAATGVMLLVQGVMYLVENFDKLSQGSGILAKALRVVGDVIGTVKDALYAVTDAIGLTNSELDKQGEAIKSYADKTTEALQQQTKEFDNQIKVARAAGQSTIELEKAKQEAIVETNKKIVEQIIAFVRAGGELDDEKKKQLTSSLQLIKDARTEEKVIELNHQKEISDKAKKATEDKKKLLEEETAKRLEELEKQRKYEYDLNEQRKKWDKELSDQISNNLKKTLKDQSESLGEQADAEFLAAENKRAFRDSEHENTFAENLETIAKERDEKLKNESLTQEERIAIIKDSNKKETELKEAQREQNAQIAKQGLNAIQGLSDLYFQSQLKSAKGNAAKEKEIRKQQFNVNKAFGITNAVIDGVRGVQSALAMGPPAGYVFAALSAVMAGINIAKIASAKFDEGGSSSGATDVGSAVGSAASAAPPTVATPQNTVDTTKFGDGGKNLEMTPPKAQVVETEITSKQKIVTKMEGQAVF